GRAGVPPAGALLGQRPAGRARADGGLAWAARGRRARPAPGAVGALRPGLLADRRAAVPRAAAAGVAPVGGGDALRARGVGGDVPARRPRLLPVVPGDAAVLPAAHARA